MHSVFTNTVRDSPQLCVSVDCECDSDDRGATKIPYDCRFTFRAAEQPNDALPSDGSIPSEAAKKPRLNSKLI